MATIEMINAMLNSKHSLVKRNGMPNEANIAIMKRLQDITEAEIERFKREDEGWNWTPQEKHERGYHSLRALDRWYKEHKKDRKDGDGDGYGKGKGFDGGSGGMDGKDGERKPDGRSGSGDGDGKGDDGDGKPKDGNGNGSGSGDGEAKDGEAKDGESKDGNGNGDGDGKEGDSKEGNGSGDGKDGKDEPKDEPKDENGKGDEMKPPKDKQKKDEEELTDLERLIDACITIPRDDGKPENLYLWGDSGTGKSYGVSEVCRKKGYEYFETGKVDMPERLIGYGTADGGYYVPAFLKKAIEGPEDPNTEYLVMNSDEFDSNPNAVTLTLNNLYASRVLATPQGVFKVHPKVRFVATGNTTMDGSDDKFERETVDKSVKTRWFFHEVGYDPKVEKKLADKETVKFLQQIREAKEEIGLDLMVTYREFTRLAWSEKLIARGILTREKALDDALFKGMTEDDRLALRKDPKMTKLIEKNNKWAVEM